MKNSIRIAAGVFSAFLCAGVLQAEPPEGKSWKNDGMKGEGRFDKMKEELGLSDEQAQKLKAHKESQMAKGKALWDAMKVKKEALKSELEKEKIDEAKVKSLNGEIKAIQNQIADQRLAGVLEVRKILTPEQFQKFHDRMEERREDMKERRQERRENRREGRGSGSKKSE